MNFSQKFTTFCLVISSFLLTACLEQSAPKGFDAVIPEAQGSARPGCPDILATYRISEQQEHHWIFDIPEPANQFSFIVIESIVADNVYNFSMQMDRAHILHRAQQLRSSDPEKYYYWRENILLSEDEKMIKARTQPASDNPADFEPKLQTRGQFRVMGCDQGWMKIRQRKYSSSAYNNDTGETQNFRAQDDVWVARDKFGNLLVHTVSYRLKRGWTFWAAGGAGVRLIPQNHQWGIIKKAADSEQHIPLSAVDLPEVPKPVRSIQECQLSFEDIVEFNQNLLVQLPTGVEMTQFVPQPIALKSGYCEPQLINLEFSSTSRTAVDETIKLIEQAPIVERVELSETRMNNSHWFFVLSLQVQRKQR